ncbi:MAG TPA: SDR family oxidoreductase [Steroidobacteraceae bacterium]|nr:SDR family oxidoreductase [Steroidobacteraceae bacterium]
MRGRLAGKRCLVTGAGQGIGRSIAEAFHTEGARVIATDINAEFLRGLPADVITAPLDVTRAQDAAGLATQHPDVEVLVNCAGYVAVGNVLACTEEQFETSIAVNLRSILNMMKAFVPGMRLRGKGSIINIASVVSTTKAAPERFAYAATKAGVIAMTRSVALDFVKDGIRCNCISPGTIDTPSLSARIAASGEPNTTRTSLIARQPLGRLGRPGEVAALAVTLASDESGFMTGADLVVDGGMSL